MYSEGIVDLLEAILERLSADYSLCWVLREKGYGEHLFSEYVNQRFGLYGTPNTELYSMEKYLREHPMIGNHADTVIESLRNRAFDNPDVIRSANFWIGHKYLDDTYATLHAGIGQSEIQDTQKQGQLKKNTKKEWAVVTKKIRESGCDLSKIILIPNPNERLNDEHGGN